MACRPYNTGRCLLLRLFNPSKLWGSLQYVSHLPFSGYQESAAKIKIFFEPTKKI